MNSYWNLDDEEKAELTSDQVEAFCKVECMEQGIIIPDPPELMDEEMPVVPTKEMFEIAKPSRYSYRSEPEKTGILFETAEKAQAFIKLRPTFKEQDYDADVHYVKQQVELFIISSEIVEEQEVEKHRIVLSQVKGAKDKNATAKQEFAKAITDSKKATKGIWENWHLCRDEKEAKEKVRATFDKYAEMCDGDEEIARKFLVKATGIKICREAFPDQADLFIEEPAAEKEK